MTGLVIAVSLLPWLGPGQLLTSVTERWPRRRVMIVADLVRAAAFVLVLVPAPIPVLLAVVFGAGLATPPFEAARSALRPEIVPASTFPSAVALTSITQDLSVVVGYLAGGALVGVFGVRGALLCNAGSFVVSAWLVSGLPAAPAPRPNRLGGVGGSGARALVGDRLIVCAVVLVTASMFAATALTAVSAPLVLAVLGGGPRTVGVLVALSAVVSIAATAAVPVRDNPSLLLRWAAAYTTVGGLVVVGCFTAVRFGAPNMPLTVAAYAADGLLFAVMAPANIVVSPRLPGAVRASALSLLMGVLVATEALAAAAAGSAASVAGLLPAGVAVGAIPLAVGAWVLLHPPLPAATA